MAGRKKTSSKSKQKPAKRSAAVLKRKGSKAKGAKKIAKRATKSAPRLTLISSGPVSVGRKPFSKSQFIAEICSRTGVSRKEVVAVLDVIAKIIGAHLNKSGPETFNWPGLFKILVVKKPATKARQGINPFTGESMMFKAKPASRRVKVRPLKQLKEMAA